MKEVEHVCHPLVALLAMVAVWGGALLPDPVVAQEPTYQESKWYTSNVEAMAKAYRDLDWPYLVERGHDNLMRVPGDSETLRWVGLALEQLGCSELALRILKASGVEGSDETVRKTVETLSRNFGVLVIEYINPPQGLFAEAPPTYQQLGIPESGFVAGHPAVLLALPRESREKLVAEIRDIRDLALPERRPLALREPGKLSVRYEGILVSHQGHDVKMQHDLGQFGFANIEVLAAIKPGVETVVRVECKRLGTLRIVGVQPGDSVMVDGRKTSPDPSGGMALPEGSHTVFVVRGDLHFPLGDAEVPPGGELALKLPAILRLIPPSSQRGLRVKVDGAELPSKGEQNLFYFLEAGRDVSVEATMPRYVPVTLTVRGEPGREVTVSAAEQQWVLTDDWRQFYSVRSLRRAGWFLNGVGFAAAAAAATTGGLAIRYKLKADDAHEEYEGATAPEDVAFYEDKTRKYDRWRGLSAYAAVGGTVLAAGLVGVGTWLLLANPAVEEPGAQSASREGPSAFFWVDETGGGVSFGARF